MKNITPIITIITLIAAISSILGLIYGTRLLTNPKDLSFMTIFTVTLGFIFCIYISGMAGLGVIALFHSKYLATIVFSAFTAAPFVIGTFATHEKSREYINIQIAVFLLSIMALIMYAIN